MVGGNWRKILSSLAATISVFQFEKEGNILCNRRCDNRIYHLYRAEGLDGTRLFAGIF